jgi:hypothetical protein
VFPDLSGPDNGKSEQLELELGMFFYP